MKVLASAVVGAVVVFIWTGISWMALPWHNLDFRFFKNDAAVAQVLRDQAPEDGVYVVPNLPGMKATAEQRDQWSKSVAQGPYAYISLKVRGSNWNMGTALIIQFAAQLVIALVLAWIVSKMGMTDAFQIGLVCALAVMTGGFYEDLRYWNWWGFPAGAVWVNVADLGLGWFLGGVAIAKVLARKS